MNEVQDFLRETIERSPIVLFMKGTPQFPQCGFSGRAVQLLKSCGAKDLIAINVLEDQLIREEIKKFSNWPTIPQLYIKGEFIGGSDIISEMYQTGELENLIKLNGKIECRNL